MEEASFLVSSMRKKKMSDQIIEFIYDNSLQKRPKNCRATFLYYIHQRESNYDQENS